MTLKQKWTSSKIVHLQRPNTSMPGTLNIHELKWMFQLDDSKLLHEKLVFHQTSIKKQLPRVPGTSTYIPPGK